MRISSRIVAKSFFPSLYHGVGVVGIGLAVAGCSRGPSRVEVPSYDPSGSASQAMKMYDTDGDGFIAGEELEKATTLKAAIQTIDSDKNGKISAEEISARVNAWEATGAGLTTARCQVTLDAKPLVGATVTFEPEEFLSGVIQTAVGTTNREGVVSPRIPKENRPSSNSPSGIQLGLYKVKISKIEGGVETVPAKYNEATVLGQQIAPDDPAVKSQLIRFNLVTIDK